MADTTSENPVGIPATARTASGVAMALTSAVIGILLFVSAHALRGLRAADA